MSLDCRVSKSYRAKSKRSGACEAGTQCPPIKVGWPLTGVTVPDHTWVFHSRRSQCLITCRWVDHSRASQFLITGGLTTHGSYSVYSQVVDHSRESRYSPTGGLTTHRFRKVRQEKDFLRAIIIIANYNIFIKNYKFIITTFYYIQCLMKVTF